MIEILQVLKDIRHLLSFNKQMLTVDEASKYIGISKAYLYQLTATGKIKHYKPFKQIYFKREEVDLFLQQNPVASQEDIEVTAINFLTSKGIHHEK